MATRQRQGEMAGPLSGRHGNAATPGTDAKTAAEEDRKAATPRSEIAEQKIAEQKDHAGQKDHHWGRAVTGSAHISRLPAATLPGLSGWGVGLGENARARADGARTLCEGCAAGGVGCPGWACRE